MQVDPRKYGVGLWENTVALFWIRLKHDDAVDHGKWRKSIKHIE